MSLQCAVAHTHTQLSFSVVVKKCSPRIFRSTFAVLARSGLVLAAAVASALSLALFSLCAGFLSLVRWLRRPKVVPFVRIFGLALILS